ncbi:MAG: CapA family protein [Clostridia bacterium]|nr:CapA family protein [Clostridia bacterium]
MRKDLCIILVLLLSVLCFSAVAETDSDVTYHDVYYTPTPVPTATPAGYTPTPEPPPPTPVPTATPRYEADGSVVLTLTAVGDVTIGRNAKYSGSSIFEKELKRQDNDVNFIFRNVRDILKGDDVTIINFEGVLADEYSIPSKKRENSFLFVAPTSYAEALVNGSVEIATIENNHIDDFGDNGRASTQKTLTENDITWADEFNMASYEVQGVKIAVLSYKTFDYYDTLNKKVPAEVASAKATHDLVIVCYHWGAEKDYYPNDRQQKLAHATIDAGADLIIGHHSHRINPIEEYNGKYIVYSVGNFSFAGNNKPDDMSTFIFQTRFRMKDGQIIGNSFRIVPCRISSKTDYNDFAPTPYTEQLRIDNVINTMLKNGKYIKNAVESYPLDWE